MHLVPDRRYVLRVTDFAYREIATSAHATLAEAMTAGDEAKQKLPTLHRRYFIDAPDGDRWELVGGDVMRAWRKE